MYMSTTIDLSMTTVDAASSLHEATISLIIFVCVGICLLVIALIWWSYTRNVCPCCNPLRRCFVKPWLSEQKVAENINVDEMFILSADDQQMTIEGEGAGEETDHI